jgi:hypothetical protein
MIPQMNLLSASNATDFDAIGDAVGDAGGWIW